MRSSWLIDGGDLTGTRGHLSEAAPGLCPGTTAAPRFAGRVKTRYVLCGRCDCSSVSAAFISSNLCRCCRALSAMAEPGAPEHDAGRTGSQWSGSRLLLSLLDLDLRGLQMNLPMSESDDSSEGETESSSVVTSFMTTRELCVCGCGKWAWLHDTCGWYYNGMCFQDEELQINSGWLNCCTSAISRTRRSALQRVIQLEDIYMIIESFLIGDLFSKCCRESCGTCVKTWFLKGWVCPHHWM